MARTQRRVERLQDKYESLGHYQPIRNSQRIDKRNEPSVGSWQKINVECLGIIGGKFVLVNSRTDRFVSLDRSCCRRIGIRRFIVRVGAINKCELNYAVVISGDVRSLPPKDLHIVDFSKRVSSGGIMNML